MPSARISWGRNQVPIQVIEIKVPKPKEIINSGGNRLETLNMKIELYLISCAVEHWAKLHAASSV